MSNSGAEVASAAVREPRTAEYRRLASRTDLERFNVKVEQTDLLIAAERLLIDDALTLVHRYRADIVTEIERRPEFLTSLVPLPVDKGAPAIVRAMGLAAHRMGVGPMAAVAGAIAEFVGRELAKLSPEVIVENGGDIFCCTRQPRAFMLLAEKSAFGALRVRIDSKGEPFGVCTSSATSGHSLSFGRADAVMVASPDAALADAAATALCNMVQQPSDLQQCVERARASGAIAAVAVMGEKLAAWGALELEAWGDG